MVDHYRGFVVVLPGRLSWRREAVPSWFLPVRARTSEEVVFPIDKRRRGLHIVIRLHSIIPCGSKDPMPVPFPG